MNADVTLNARDFMQMLKDEGLVIGPRTVFESDKVEGVPFQEYRERIKRRKLISFSEISKAKLWGEIGQKQVYNIAKKELPSSDFATIDNRLKIPRETVKSIAVARGFEF